MTRHEMSQMRQSFLAQAITDVKERLVNLMDRNQMDVNQVANSLSLSTAEVNAILNENVDALSLKAFATILIINGLVMAVIMLYLILKVI